MDKTLYSDLKAAGIPISNHESDLYFKYSPESVAILDKYPLEKSNAQRFRNCIDGTTWVDVPFAYIPWWEAHCGQTR